MVSAENMVMGALSIASLTLCLVAYLRPRTVKRLGYCEHAWERRHPGRTGVNRLGRQNKLPTTDFVTRVAVANIGLREIKGTDVVADEPLRWHISRDSELQSARILHHSRKANRFKVRSDGNAGWVELTFDFIDRGDGCIIEIAHRGGNSYVDRSGTIRGTRISWGFTSGYLKRMLWILVVGLSLFGPFTWGWYVIHDRAVTIRNPMVVAVLAWGFLIPWFYFPIANGTKYVAQSMDVGGKMDALAETLDPPPSPEWKNVVDLI